MRPWNGTCAPTPGFARLARPRPPFCDRGSIFFGHLLSRTLLMRIRCSTRIADLLPLYRARPRFRSPGSSTRSRGGRKASLRWLTSVHRRQLRRAAVSLTQAKSNRRAGLAAHEHITQTKHKQNTTARA